MQDHWSALCVFQLRRVKSALRMSFMINNKLRLLRPREDRPAARGETPGYISSWWRDLGPGSEKRCELLTANSDRQLRKYLKQTTEY